MTEDITLRDRVSPSQFRDVDNASTESSPLYDFITHNPFADEGSMSYFFEGGSRAEQLDETVHLTQFGNNITLVVGDTGVGKTFFLEQACFELSETASCCFITGSIELSSETIAKEISTELSMPFATRQTIEQLIEMLEDADALEDISRFILVVDDIHLLSEEIVFSLMQLSQVSGSVFHLLASGLPSTASYLSNLEFQEDLIKEIYLFPYGPEATEEYINFKMQSVGYKGDNFFNDGMLAEIYKSSAGYPQKINKTAEYFLLSHDENIADELVERNPSGFPLWHMVGAIFLVFLLILAFFYRGDSIDKAEGVEQILSNPIENKNPVENTVQNEATIAVEENPNNLPLPSAVISEDLTVNNIPDEQINSAAEQSAEEVPAATQETPTSEVVETAVDVPENAEPQTVVTQNIQTTATEENSTSVGNASESNATSAEPTALYSVDEQTVLGWPEGDSTIQVIGALDKTSLEQYIATQANKESLRLVTIMRNDQPWHIVLADHYPDNNQAREAIQRLPQNQVNAGPWVRKISELKQGIRDFRR